MAKIRPSDIVKFIDKVFPTAKECQNEGKELMLPCNHAPSLEYLLKMLEEIPEAILQLSKDDLTGFRYAQTVIKNKLESWKSHHGPMRSLSKTQGYSKENPVIVIRQLLEKRLF